MPSPERTTVALSAWAGFAAGLASALADFGAHWLFMDSASDRLWLCLRLLALQAAAGATLGTALGLWLAGTGALAVLLDARRAPVRRALAAPLQACLVGLLASPLAAALSQLLWSGGMMSRLRFKALGVAATTIVLTVGVAGTFWAGRRIVEHTRGLELSRARRWLLGGLACAFAIGKLNQWVLPNLYDYLHATLSFAAYALYAVVAADALLRVLAGREQYARRVSQAATLLIVLMLGLAYLTLRTLDQNQNVRVALLSANMPSSRALLMAAAPLIPKVEAQSSELAKARAAASRARRAQQAVDPSLPELTDAHILLITIDALRADHLGSYGYVRPTSPQLDALAAEGTLFEHAYAQAPHSSYSLCSMLTSEYLHETTELGITPPEQTLPRMLADDGYHTAGFYTQGIFHTASERLGTYERDAFGFALHDHQDRPAEQMTDRALEEIERTLQRGEPSALFWVHYFNVHEPYRATTFGTRDVDRYDSEILAADAAIGRLVRSARARLTKPLIVVITADHGEEFHEHGGVYHGSSTYEEQVHIPLILLVPGAKPQRYAQPVESIDIVPTLLGLVGAPAPPTLRGVDLRALLSHPERERGPVFSAVIHKKMVVRWPYKLVADLRFDAYELYDLSRDPAERQNRSDNEPKRLRELRAEVYAWLDALATTHAAQTRTAQALEWGRLGDRRAVQPLQELLLDNTAAPTDRREAAQLLGKLGDPLSAESLLDATEIAPAWVSAEAAIALGRMFDDRARPALQRLVTSEDPGIRSRAAVSLARLRDAASVPALIDALWLAPTPYEREEAVRWLGRLGDASALDPLLNLLPETHTRHLVVLALGDLGDKRAFEALVETLHLDRNTHVRDGAVRALATLGDPRALKVLLPLVTEDSALRNTGEALVRLDALGRGVVGGADIDQRTAQNSLGFGDCHQGPLRHDWDFAQRTYCRTTRAQASLNLKIPEAVARAPEGTILLVSLRRADASTPTEVTLRLGRETVQMHADGGWSEQRFVLPSDRVPKGRQRVELLVSEPGAHIELDHILIVPTASDTVIASHQGG